RQLVGSVVGYLVGSTERDRIHENGSKISVLESKRSLAVIGEIQNRYSIRELIKRSGNSRNVGEAVRIQLAARPRQLEPIYQARKIAVRLIAERKPAENGTLAGIERNVKRPLTGRQQVRFLRDLRAVRQRAGEADAAGAAHSHRSITFLSGLRDGNIGTGN